MKTLFFKSIMLLLSVLIVATISTVPAAVFAEEPLQNAFQNGGQPVSRAVIVEQRNDNANFAVGITLNRENLAYTEDDLVGFSIKTSRDGGGYLYVLHIDSKENVTLLFPNKFRQDNRIAENATVIYPAADADFQFRVTEPFGKETIKAIVCKEHLKSIDHKNFTKVSVMPLNGNIPRGIAVELKQERTGNANAFAEHEVTYTTYAKNNRPETPTVKRYAVCFGISNFKDSNIRNLKACVNDARYYAELLNEQCGVPKDNILVLTDEQVTLENVKKVFNEILPPIIKTGDVVFLYWSGHGGQTASATPGKEYDQFLIPYDADVNDIKNTVLFEDAFGHWIQRLSGCKVFFVLDACHSGGMLQGNALTESKNFDNTLANTFSNKKSEDTGKGAKGWKPLSFGLTVFDRSKSIGQRGLAALASSASSEISFEREDRVTSVFTQILIDAVKTSSQDVTHKDLKNKVEKKVQDYVQQHFPGATQTVVELDDLAPALLLKE
ncbi:MAG: caspase family protein [Planctomycetaceae bacterium]|nr:caspase family protein [Planctomycetaceae bacterium]